MRTSGLCAAGLLVVASGLPVHGAGLPGPAFPSFQSAAAVAAYCDSGLARANGALKKLEQQPPNAAWLAAYDDLDALLEDLAGPIYLLSNVHPDKAVRDAADACELRWQDFTSSLGQNATLYQAASQRRERDPINALLLKTLREDFEDAGKPELREDWRRPVPCLVGAHKQAEQLLHPMLNEERPGDHAKQRVNCAGPSGSLCFVHLTEEHPSSNRLFSTSYRAEQRSTPWRTLMPCRAARYGTCHERHADVSGCSARFASGFQ